MKSRIGITMFSSREGLRHYTKTQYNYVTSVAEAGGLPVLIPTPTAGSVDSDELNEIAAEYVEGLDALVFSGGEDINPIVYDQDPRAELGPTDIMRDWWEIRLMQAAERMRRPVLAICRGIQVMNVARGGSLIQDIAAQTGRTIGHFAADMPMESYHHSVSIEPNTLTSEVFSGRTTILVNSFHHQAVAEPADGLVVTARAADGVIEAIEDPILPFWLGLQWHAEALPRLEKYYLAPFTALVRATEEAAGI